MADREKAVETADNQEQILRKLQVRLAEVEQELDFLSYAISHDLRAPLRTLFGFSTLLVRKHGDKLEGQPLDYLKRILSGAARMETMIEELLKLSRVSRAEIQREQVDLSALAASVIDEMQVAEPGRPVESEVEPGLSCMGDQSMLHTVLHNLLQNAWKFTEGTPSPQIRFFAEVKEGRRFYCVRDNGAGFAVGQADRLFRPFQRLHLETEFPGVGMGLALVKKIIQRHDGIVRAEGAEGAGATFCFTIGDT